VKPQPITAPRAIFTLAAVTAMPMFHSGCGDLELLGRPALDARSRLQNVEIVGRIQDLDHSRSELYLLTQGGQNQVVTYTNHTRVIVDGEETPTSNLGVGDIIEVRMHGTADGRAVADSIQVRERGRAGHTVVEGTVQQVLRDRRVIELRTPSGALTTVYLPHNSPEVVEDELSQLRSGDFVRFQGTFLGESRFESTRVLKQPQ